MPSSVSLLGDPKGGALDERGFLGSEDPLLRLPESFEELEECAAEIPRLLVSGCIRRRVVALSEIDVAALESDAELRRAMLLLSFLGHAYVWGEAEPSRVLPANLARPWHRVATRLGRPPVLSYASYAIDNWRRLDPSGGISLGNIALLQHFLGGADEEWFITVHIDIEAKAGPALVALHPAQRAALDEDADRLTQELTAIAGALEGMHATLSRTPEWCDPYIYYTRVRPYIFGWKNHPALPDGVVYEGVAEYEGKPQLFRGETGAQSSIIPALDAALGVQHHPDPLREYLMEMRDYMPPAHRAFIESLERGESLSVFVTRVSGTHPEAREAFNACVHWIGEFRTRHLEFAASYIHQQSQRATTNPTGVGTGGTPFMRYLKKHRDETDAHHLSERTSVKPA
jgi:indoleamine 2,3-dioxygenase